MSMTTDVEPISVKQRDAARLMGVSVWTIKRWEDKKLISSKTVNGVKLYPYAQLKKLLGAK